MQHVDINIALIVVIGAFYLIAFARAAR